MVVEDYDYFIVQRRHCFFSEQTPTTAFCLYHLYIQEVRRAP